MHPNPPTLCLLDGRERWTQVSPCCHMCTDVSVGGVLLTPDALRCALCIQFILTCVHSCTHMNSSYLSSTASTGGRHEGAVCLQVVGGGRRKVDDGWTTRGQTTGSNLVQCACM
eukprot:scaffold2045_cov203-Alexandrium_tamarense.AAC.18